jgi:L,D-transpeptidase ErfK/SrfK
MTYPMSIGRMDWETPLGPTRVVSKVRDPSWYPPASVRAEHEADGRPLPRIVPPGPDNPLGGFAMRLALPGYLIHSTNRPAGVGMRVTHGCIRMFPEDIGFLFERVGIDTPVQIINEPVKLGWDGDELLIEVHRTLDAPPLPRDAALAEVADVLTADPELAVVVPEAGGEPAAAVDAAADEKAVPPPAERGGLTLLTEMFVVATSARPGKLDWDAAESQLERASGIPRPVGRGIKNAATSAAFE